MAAFQEEGGANLTQDVVMDRDAVGRVLEGGANLTRDIMMDRETVGRVLDRMFVGTSQEVAGCVRAGGAEEACGLMFRLLDRSVPVLSRSPVETGSRGCVCLCCMCLLCVCVFQRSLRSRVVSLSSDGSDRSVCRQPAGEVHK